MPEFFDVKGEVTDEATPAEVTRSEVKFSNKSEFPADVRKQVQEVGSNMKKLQNSESGYVNDMKCRPKNDGTFTCEAVVNDTIITEDGLKAVRNMVITAEKKDVVRIRTEDIKLEDEVLKVNDK